MSQKSAHRDAFLFRRFISFGVVLLIACAYLTTASRAYDQDAEMQSIIQRFRDGLQRNDCGAVAEIIGMDGGALFYPYLNNPEFLDFTFTALESTSTCRGEMLLVLRSAVVNYPGQIDKKYWGRMGKVIEKSLTDKNLGSEEKIEGASALCIMGAPFQEIGTKYFIHLLQEPPGGNTPNEKKINHIILIGLIYGSIYPKKPSKNLLTAMRKIIRGEQLIEFMEVCKNIGRLKDYGNCAGNLPEFKKFVDEKP